MSSASLVTVHLNRLALDPETPSIRRVAAHDVLWNVELIEQILPCTSPATFICFSKTCRTARILVTDWSRRVFDINNHLARFFSDPRAFRALQASTGTLISGSNALQFLDRTIYEDSDLDLYMSSGVELAVGRYLQGDNYTFVTRNSQNTDFEEWVEDVQWSDDEAEDYWGNTSSSVSLRVYNFVRSSGDKLFHRKIQLVVSERSPLETVLQFHSTCVLNFISYRHAYSLFPRGTFEDRVSLDLPSDYFDHERFQQKYSERGWKFLDTHDDIAWESFSTEKVYGKKAGYVGEAIKIHARDVATNRAARAPAFNIGSRWIDDRDSWVLDLDMTWPDSPSGRILGMLDPSNQSNPLDFDIMRCNNFSLLCDPGGKDCFFSYCRVGCNSLKYRYLLSDIEWCSALSEKVFSYEALFGRQDTRTALKEKPIFFDARLLDWRERYLRKSQVTQKRPHALKPSSLYPQKTVCVDSSWIQLTFTRPPFKSCGQSPTSPYPGQLETQRRDICKCEACALSLQAKHAREEKKAVKAKEHAARTALAQRGRGRGRGHASIGSALVTASGWGSVASPYHISYDHASTAGAFRGGPTVHHNAGAGGRGGTGNVQPELRGRGRARGQVYHEPSNVVGGSRGGRGAHLSTGPGTGIGGRGGAVEALRGSRGRGRGRS